MGDRQASWRYSIVGVDKAGGIEIIGNSIDGIPPDQLDVLTAML
jgi:hypothetical protein